MCQSASLVGDQPPELASDVSWEGSVFKRTSGTSPYARVRIVKWEQRNFCSIWHQGNFLSFAAEKCRSRSMSRFFFHVYDKGRLIADEEGSECRNIGEALDEAKASAHDLAKQALARHEPADHICVEVHDENGKVVAALTAAEVIARPQHPRFIPTCQIESPRGARH